MITINIKINNIINIYLLTFTYDFIYDESTVSLKIFKKLEV